MKQNYNMSEKHVWKTKKYDWKETWLLDNDTLEI